MSDCGHHHDPVERPGEWPPAAHVCALVIAAGRSSRMGRVKALLPLKEPWGKPPGETALERILRLLARSGTGRVLSVLGHHKEEIRKRAARASTLVVNPEPERGMFSSIQAGIEVALRVPRPPEAILLWPVDLPLVEAKSLWMLLNSGTRAGANPEELWVRILALESDLNAEGHPVLFSKAVAQRVLSAGSEGRLDHILCGKDVRRERVLVNDPMIMRDLDYPSEAEPFLLKKNMG